MNDQLVNNPITKENFRMRGFYRYYFQSALIYIYVPFKTWEWFFYKKKERLEEVERRSKMEHNFTIFPKNKKKMDEIIENIRTSLKEGKDLGKNSDNDLDYFYSNCEKLSTEEMEEYVIFF
jgi:hypothetical protein